MVRVRKNPYEPGQALMVFSVKRHYGNYMYYPVNELAKKARDVFAYRKGMQSFTRDQVLFFKHIGIHIETRVSEDEGAV